MSGRIANRVRVSETRCPYCHEEIVRGEEPVCCPGCHAAHHAACLSERPSCSACGVAHPRFAGAAPATGARVGEARVKVRMGREGAPRSVLERLLDDLAEVRAFARPLVRVFSAAWAGFKSIVDGIVRLVRALTNTRWALLALLSTVFGAALIGLGVILVVIVAA